MIGSRKRRVQRNVAEGVLRMSNFLSKSRGREHADFGNSVVAIAMRTGLLQVNGVGWHRTRVFSRKKQLVWLHFSCPATSTGIGRYEQIFSKPAHTRRTSATLVELRPNWLNQTRFR